MATDTSAPTRNEKLLAWVDEIAQLTEPEEVQWCDGSAEEYDRLAQMLVDADVVAGADPIGCSIYLNAAAFARMPKAMVCSLVLHEYGHLAGHADSDDPGSVMYRFYVGPDPRCTDTGS